MKKLFRFLAIIIIFQLKSTHAQFNLYLNYQGIYDDNIYNNNQQISDFINSFDFGAAYNLESEFNNFQIYYEGGLNYFRENTSKSFDAHRFGLVETYLFSEDDNPFNVGINYSIRYNKDEFEVYNFDQISAYANYRHSIGEMNFILPGYVFNRNDYKNFTLFSHFEHKLFLTWISNFETLTSLTLNGEFNYKNYFEEYDYEDYLNEASQLKFLLNIGQSLGENTGINGYTLVRINLSEGSRYLLSDSLIYYEEEIFNDIYSYDGIEIGLGFKHLFTETFELNLEAKYLRKNYSSLPVADTDGKELSSLREDTLLGFGIGVDFNLNSILNGLSFSAAWNYFDNTSNDSYYTYTNQVVSASFNYGF